ncbi:hypothetical protein Tco_0976128 [Tanacetum coccineum]|uniref:Uncharacterized protein n=1 Tax=Tanacetum coccineum TaxID=301880 RepID=A0ABQ5EGC9_9ASTR
MDYFISVHPRSNVRFSALFLDSEEKSSFHPNDFPSTILQKIICVFHGGKVTMADANINAPEVPVAADSPPTRSDEQILPRNKWVPVGKSNCFLDVERTQANPIFKIAVDILKNTNFFKAFTASSTIPSIYIQQFWDTIRFDKDKGYSCQLDEQRFYLTKATLRDALQLPQDNNNFTPPPNANTIISFVNELGYPNVIRTLFGVVTNDTYQPWRALATIINLCLMGKTSAFERPRAQVLQILWGVVNKANIDYGERIWEEFTQCSPLYLPYEESALGYLKFSFKNTKRVAKCQRYLAREVVSDDEAPAPKPAKGAKPKTPRKPKPQSTSSQPPKPKHVPAKPQEKKRKLATDATEAPSPAKRLKAGKVLKKRTLKSSRQLVDEFIDEGVPADEPSTLGSTSSGSDQRTRTWKISTTPEVQGKGKEKVGEEQAAQVLLNLQTPKKKNPAKQFIFQRRTPATAEPSGLVETSSLYAELGLTVSETDSDEEVSPEMNAKAQEEGQGGTNPGDAGVSQTPSSHVVHAGPNLDHMDLGIAEASSQPNTKQMDEEFTVTAYPKGTSPVPLMTTPVIDLTVSQPAPTTIQASLPTSTKTTEITTTTLPSPSPQRQQGISNSIIIQRIGELERCIADQEDTNQALEERLDKQGNKIHQLETQDLSRMIREQTVEYIDKQEIDRKIKETVKEAVTASV